MRFLKLSYIMETADGKVKQTNIWASGSRFWHILGIEMHINSLITLTTIVFSMLKITRELYRFFQKLAPETTFLISNSSRSFGVILPTTGNRYSLEESDSFGKYCWYCETVKCFSRGLNMGHVWGSAHLVKSKFIHLFKCQKWSLSKLSSVTPTATDH